MTTAQKRKISQRMKIYWTNRRSTNPLQPRAAMGLDLSGSISKLEEQITVLKQAQAILAAITGGN